MPSPDTITVPQLTRLMGLPEAPSIIDVRTDEDFARDPRLLPASLRHDHRNVTSWADNHAGRASVVVCQRGMKLSQGVAAWIRLKGGRAEVLEGGFEAWAATADAPLIRPDHLPPRNAEGQTVWVTRARPKIDRIACRDQGAAPDDARRGANQSPAPSASTPVASPSPIRAPERSST